MNGTPLPPKPAEPGTARGATGLGPSETQRQVLGGKPGWVLVVVGLYAFALLAPLGLLVSRLGPQRSGDLARGLVLIAAVLLSQVGLVVVPLRVARRRPIRRSALWIPLVTSGALLALLVGALGMAASGLLQDRAPDSVGTAVGYAFAALAVGSWIVWVAVFYRMSATQEPEGIGLALHQWLLKGSVLELLIALPAHIIERQRDKCSSSVETFLGVCTGLSIMLLAFGPAVAVLYIRRWMNIQPKSVCTLSPETQKRRVLIWSLLAGLASALLLILILWVGFLPETQGLLRR